MVAPTPFFLSYLLTYLLTNTKPYGKRYRHFDKISGSETLAIYDGILRRSFEFKHSCREAPGALRNAPASDPTFFRFRHPELQPTSIANIGHRDHCSMASDP
jgi:hypothetical protein